MLANFWVFVPFFYIKKCVVLIKSACPFGQVKNKMYLLKNPFFKDSLAMASGLVLMSNPVLPLSLMYISMVSFLDWSVSF